MLTPEEIRAMSKGDVRIVSPNDPTNLLFGYEDKK